MKKIILAVTLLPLLILVRLNFGVHAQAQSQSVSIVSKEDATMLLDTMNVPKDKVSGALVFTLKFWNTNEQRLYIWRNGQPTGDSTASFMRQGYIIQPKVIHAGGDTVFYPGYWDAATFYTDAALVRNLAYRVGLSGFAKMSSVLTERARALDAEAALSNQIAAIPAGATGPQGNQGIQGIQGVPGTSPTPNTASTPLSIASNVISIQTANGSQPGALSAADWTTFNSKLSTVPAQSYASLTGKPVLFDGQYSSLTGRPTLFDGNYNSLSNLPTLFTDTQANALYRPITYTPSAQDIATALGYTPYNGTANTSGFLTSTSLIGYQPLLTVGTTSQYRRGDNSVATLNSSVVPELTNLYWTDARFNTSFSSKSTTDLAEGVNQYFTQLRARAAISALANGGVTYNAATGEVSQTTPIYNNAPGRTLNTSFRPSTVRPTRVSYTVSITTALSLLNLNSSGTVALQISADNVNWITINSAGVTRTLAVSLSVGLNDTSLFNIQGEIPIGFYCRMLPTVSGGATVTMNSGQEVTY